jgi:hypothetical protein
MSDGRATRVQYPHWVDGNTQQNAGKCDVLITESQSVTDPSNVIGGLNAHLNPLKMKEWLRSKRLE